MVCIVLVNYNGYQDTVECIKSLKKIAYSNYKIILVDNNSQDVEKLKSDTWLNENAEVLCSEQNLGFSGGNNMGIRYAQRYHPSYVLLLNNDTEVETQFLEHLVNVAEQDEKIGIVTGKIYYHSHPEELWYCGGNYNCAKGFTNTMVCVDKKEPCDVSFVTGCLMLIRNKCFEKCGLLREDFFLYSEDTEYGCRVLRNGYRLVWTPDAIIYHKVSASTGNNSKFQQYYLVRNNLYMISYFGTRKLYAYLYRAYCCMKEILKGNYQLRPVLDAYIDFIKGQIGRSKKY